MAYSNLQIFTVELVGTFILVVFATGSIVLDAEMFNGELGIPFHAVAPFVALLIGVYSCLLYTSPSPRDRTRSRMPSSA